MLLTAYPSGRVARYRARRHGDQDPVAAVCRKIARGFLRSEPPSLIALTDKQIAIMEDAKLFGLGVGFTTPIHVPEERMGVCSFVVGV